MWLLMDRHSMTLHQPNLLASEAGGWSRESRFSRGAKFGFSRFGVRMTGRCLSPMPLSLLSEWVDCLVLQWLLSSWGLEEEGIAYISKLKVAGSSSSFS